MLNARANPAATLVLVFVGVGGFARGVVGQPTVIDPGQGPFVLGDDATVAPVALGGLTWLGSGGHGDRFLAVSDETTNIFELMIDVDADTGAIASATTIGAVDPTCWGPTDFEAIARIEGGGPARLAIACEAGDRVLVFDRLDASASVEALLEHPWSVSRFEWVTVGAERGGDGRPRFRFLVNERGHQALRVVEVDPRAGDGDGVGVWIDETSDTFVDYAGKTFLRTLPDGDAIWMSRLADAPAPAGDLAKSPECIGVWNDLVAARREMDARILDWAGSIAQGDIDGTEAWYSGAVKRNVTLPRAVCIVHMFNHQTHHRGQVHAMLTAAGARPDDTDLIFMPDATG